MTALPASAAAFRTTPALRLTRRGRLVLTTIAVAAAVVLALVFAMTAMTPTATAGASSQVSYVSVTVHEGDNLWTIASQHAPASMDVRDYILLVEEINGLQNGVVHPGSSLSLPVLDGSEG